MRTPRGYTLEPVDLQNATDAEVTEIRRIWLDHLVVFFREQELSPAEYMAFARRLGGSKYARSKTRGGLRAFDQQRQHRVLSCPERLKVPQFRSAIPATL